MALDTDVFDADEAAVIADLPATLLWTNPSEVEEEISCTKGNSEQSVELEVPGIFTSREVTVVARVASFASPTVLPLNGDLVTLDGTPLRVVSKSLNETTIILNLDRTTA